MNRYFLGLVPTDIQLALAINIVIFGNIIDQRTSIDGLQIIVMLPDGDTKTHECLSTFQEFTSEGIIAKIKDDPNWIKQ